MFQFEAKPDEKPEPTFVGEDFKEGFNEKMKQKICIATGLLRDPELLREGNQTQNALRTFYGFFYVWFLTSKLDEPFHLLKAGLLRDPLCAVKGIKPKNREAILWAFFLPDFYKQA